MLRSLFRTFNDCSLMCSHLGIYRRLEASDALANTFAEFGQLLRFKYEQSDGKNDG